MTMSKDGRIKRETESLIMAGQEQIIRANTMKAKMDMIQAELSVDCVVK